MHIPMKSLFLAAAGAVAVATVPVHAAEDASCKTVRFAEVGWSDIAATTGMASVVLEGLGPAVYPLMAYLGKVLELRSQKVLLARLSPAVTDCVGRCLSGAAEGPFFGADELVHLFEQGKAHADDLH